MAGGVVAALAVPAVKAGDMVADKDAVADLDVLYFGTHLCYYACGFMPKHTGRFGYTVPFHNVAAADAACHYFHEDFFVAWFGCWDFLDSHVMVVVVECGKQSVHQKRRGVMLFL